MIPSLLGDNTKQGGSDHPMTLMTLMTPITPMTNTPHLIHNNIILRKNHTAGSGALIYGSHKGNQKREETYPS